MDLQHEIELFQVHDSNPLIVRCEFIHLLGLVTEHPPGGHCHPPSELGEGDLSVTKRGL